MPFDSNGVFSRVMNWTQDQQDGIAIECGRHDDEDDNFANGLSNCFCRDGRAAATGNFNLGNHKIQNLAAGTATTDAVNKGQIDNITTNMVKISGNQTIAGVKTFSATISGSINGNAATVTNGVYTTGNQTIAGVKTFTQNVSLTNDTESYRHIYSNNSAVTKGTTPSENAGTDFVFRDSASSNIGAISMWYNNSGNIRAAIRTYAPVAGSSDSADFTVNNYLDGTARLDFSTSGITINNSLSDVTNSTASTTIPTMGWVNNPATSTNVVHRSGNETIAGTKTFSSSPVVPTVGNTDSTTKAATTAYVHNILAALYPVGSIYIGTQSTCPLATLISGSTWEKVATSLITEVSIPSTIAVYGNGKTLGFNDGSTNVGLFASGNTTYGIEAATNLFNVDKGTAYSGGFLGSNKGLGVTTSTNGSSGLIAKSNSITRDKLTVNIWRRTA